MKIYVTKYLFTSAAGAIQEMEAEEPLDFAPGMAVVRGRRAGLSFDQHFHGSDWHRTREAAVAHAEKMRTKKPASIDEQRKKIADMVIA